MSHSLIPNISSQDTLNRLNGPTKEGLSAHQNELVTERSTDSTKLTMAWRIGSIHLNVT